MAGEPLSQGHAVQVSMVDGALLDALEAVARHVRRSDKPFGGIQLILSGVCLPAMARSKSCSVGACCQTEVS